MSFSLKLEHGDLALSNNSYATVTGSDKLQQDLVCAILTPLGFDELHPEFGSTLIENLLDANEPGILGTRNFSQAASLVHAEIARICKNYQAQQVHRAEEDATRFGRQTLEPHEILVALKGIDFTQAEDKLICVVKLEIGNETVTLRVPMPEQENN